MLKLVWDTSAIINIKEPNEHGYSPGHSLYKDLDDGWIDVPYQNIFPALSVFEVAATVSRIHRKGQRILREFYLLNEHSVLYNIDLAFIEKSYELYAEPGFSLLQGADLVFACIAAIEDAWLVTMDRAFATHVGGRIKVLDLNESQNEPLYRLDIDAFLAKP
ncbi:MAG TPA: PIN domain-containing protein [Gammaproteobacteria bacterium]|nr:PIN domain-containing protein [Gammaproteobacteria bacterium]